MFVTLRCQNCDNIDCPIARAYIPEDSKEGCTRRVSETDSEKFQYFVNEVIPMHTSISRLQEAGRFLERIYESPLGRKLDPSGKAMESSSHHRLDLSCSESKSASRQSMPRPNRCGQSCGER